MTTFCDDHEWSSEDDSAMCPHCLATWGDLHADRTVMEEVCRNCFRGPADIAKCLSYDCNVYLCEVKK